MRRRRSRQRSPARGPLVLLLYLNEKVFQDPGGAVARLVQTAMDRRIAVAMVHEQDPSCGGVPFGHFFQQTQADAAGAAAAAVQALRHGGGAALPVGRFTAR